MFNVVPFSIVSILVISTFVMNAVLHLNPSASETQVNANTWVLLNTENAEESTDPALLHFFQIHCVTSACSGLS